MNDPRFHSYGRPISAEEIPEILNSPFDYEPHRLCIEAAEAVRKHVFSDIRLSTSASSGKMFGVLAVMDSSGETGFLAAYSGLLDQKNDDPYFVPAIFDMLKPGDFFREAELKIEEMTSRISSLRKEDRGKTRLMEEIRSLKDYLEAAGKSFSERRAARHRILDDPDTPEAVRNDMIAESQKENAAYRKEKKSVTEAIEKLERELKEKDSEIERLVEERKSFSASVQKEIFAHFILSSENGDRADLNEIFSRTALKSPPSGAGECSAPKLLHYAFSNGYRPLAIAEFWIGESPESLVRKDGHFYPACSGKCGPILEFMLKDTETENIREMALSATRDNLKILYEDEWIVAIDKPAGVLSVPGKDRNTVSASEAIGMEAIHRLDMDTSGILLLARDSRSLATMRSLFEQGRCRKQYTALIEGRFGRPGLKGNISLPLIPDYLNRPMQRVDLKNGKEAVTDYEVESFAGTASTRMLLYPRTGRTHQLRVHCAHKYGLGHPICGDRLYGNRAERLFLHATRITFMNPFTGRETDIISEAPF